jgi:hypothetical protein
LNRHRFQLIALLNLIDHILAALHLSKNGVLAVQPIRHDVRDKELAAIGVWSRVGHAERPHFVALGIVLGLILKTITRTSAASTGRIAALDHKIRDHAMENGAVVEAFLRKKYKIVDGFGRLLSKKLADDNPLRRIDCSRIFARRIDRHGRWC